ncbi:TonB-dependent receptor, partial [Porticoccaceae bacterium]|nr:TonB-dependent receptor [Porticoccaceae bacterium]
MGNRAGKNKKAITTRTIFTALFHSFVKSFTEPLQGKARKRKISSRQPVGNISTEWKQVCVRCLFATALTVTSVVASKIQAQTTNSTQHYTIEIPADNVANALNRLADQTDTVMLFPYQDAKARQANPVVGRYTLMHALAILLKDSGLVGGFSENGAISISLRDDTHFKQGREESNDMNTTTKKTLLATVIGVFAAGSMGTASAQDQIGEGAKVQGVLDEIIVTATKRGTGTSIQDTAMAISALTGDNIEKRGLVGMDDYLRTLPGVDMQDRGAGQNNVIIRGVGSSPQLENSTVGIYFGETPVTDLSTFSFSGTSGNGDLKLVDIERIEVLRGPQGTLYGSGSIGGTVRVIPVSPNLEIFEGKIATRYSQTGEEGGDNTMVQGVINIPLIENELALRAVAYQFDNSGYIDNVAASQPNVEPGIAAAIAASGVARDQSEVGGDEYTGFRLAALWQPIDQLSVTLGHTKQEIEQDGFPEVNNHLVEPFQQIRLGVGPGGSRNEFLSNDLDITSLVFSYDLGWGSVTSSSSWIDYNAVSDNDVSAFFGGFLGPAYSVFNSEQEVFIEELRFSSQFDGPFQLLAGLYYEDRDSETSAIAFWSGDVTLSDPAEELFPLRQQVALEQRAVFAEFTYEVNEQLSATVGVRHFDY